MVFTLNNEAKEHILTYNGTVVHNNMYIIVDLYSYTYK